MAGHADIVLVSRNTRGQTVRLSTRDKLPVLRLTLETRIVEATILAKRDATGLRALIQCTTRPLATYRIKPLVTAPDLTSAAILDTKTIPFWTLSFNAATELLQEIIGFGTGIEHACDLAGLRSAAIHAIQKFGAASLATAPIVANTIITAGRFAPT